MTYRGDVQLPTLTLMQALDIQSACIYAAIMYAKQALTYPEGDDLRLYFEKRSRESQAGAEILKHAMQNPKWDAQLEIIHEVSHNHWSE